MFELSLTDFGSAAKGNPKGISGSGPHYGFSEHGQGVDNILHSTRQGELDTPWIAA